MDAYYYLIAWPGALAIGGFIALPVAIGLQAWKRRIGRQRNLKWRCGQCDGSLGADDVAGEVFLAHGVHVCSKCAEVFRRRYRVALVIVPTVAAIAAVGTAIALITEPPRELSWYLGFPLLAIVLPSLGVGAAFWWRIRAAKAANQLPAPGPAPTTAVLEPLGARLSPP